ncbi:MAG: hypothetical protein DHS20C21_19010 [Gemmatimonadota bacterium]|nr:MAG: hypothetical protein DHS20C21_19010 [Gemmatimonadota bacterium]
MSLGVARIDGGPDAFTPRNVWGGVGGAKATFEGKSYGILAVDGRLWMWVSPGSDAEGYREARLAVSDDEGGTWTPLDWAFTAEDRRVFPAFLQFGPRQDGDPDNAAVYAYFIELQGAPDKLRVQRPGRVHLARADRTSLGERAAWQFHAGLDSTGQPRWVSDASASRPVFEDPAGVGWCLSVSYHSGLQRYVLITEHRKTFGGNLGFFEAPTPWGPWSTVEYSRGWGPSELPHRWFYGNIAPGWSRGDEFVFVATGVRECDRWMSVPARFVRTRDGTPDRTP